MELVLFDILGEKLNLKLNPLMLHVKKEFELFELHQVKRNLL